MKIDNKKFYWLIRVINGFIISGLLVASIFYAHKYFKNKKSKVGAEVSASKNLTSQSDWELGVGVNINTNSAPGSVKINNLTLNEHRFTGGSYTTRLPADTETLRDNDTSTGITLGPGDWVRWDFDKQYDGIKSFTTYVVPSTSPPRYVDTKECVTPNSVGGILVQCEGVSPGVWWHSILGLNKRGPGWTELDFSSLLSELGFYLANSDFVPFVLTELYGTYLGATATHTTASTQIDGGENLISWDTFTPTQSTPSYTKIEYQFRTSANGIDWSDYTEPQEYSGAPIDLSTLSAQRYLQVKATLTTYNSEVTPQIDEYTIGYTYSTTDICDDFDHIETKLSTQTDSQYQTSQSIILSSSMANQTISIDARAKNTSNQVMSGVTFSYSSETCVEGGESNQFRAPPQGGSCAISITSSCGGSSTIQISVAQEEPINLCGNGICEGDEPASCFEDCGDACYLGPIASTELSPKEATLSPGETKEFRVIFKDANGNVVDPKTVNHFKLINDQTMGATWSVEKGGGRIVSEDFENFKATFKAGSSLGTFRDTLVFYINCAAKTTMSKATIVVANPQSTEEAATPQLTNPQSISQTTAPDFIYSFIQPEEILMLKGETKTFKLRIFDNKGNEIKEGYTVSWSLSRNDAGEIVSQDGSTIKFKATKEGFYKNLIKAKVSYLGLSDFAYSSVGVSYGLGADTKWILKPNFYHINMYQNEAIKVEFYPKAIIENVPVYSDKIKPKIELLDSSVGSIIQKGDNFIIFKPQKEGCYPNLFKASFDFYGKTYSAFSGVNIAPLDPFSSYASYTPKINLLTLDKFFINNKEKTTRFTPELFDSLSRRMPHISPYYSIDSSGNLSWIPSSFRFILNDAELGEISSSGYMEIKDSLKAGTYRDAFTLRYALRDQEFSETWDLKVLDDEPDWHIANLTDKLILPPNTKFYLSNPQGEYETESSDFKEGYYVISSDSNLLEQFQPYLGFFETKEPGAEDKAIIIKDPITEEERGIALEVKKDAQVNVCDGLIKYKIVEKRAPSKEETKKSSKINFPKVIGAIATFINTPKNNILFPLTALLISIPNIFSLASQLLRLRLRLSPLSAVPILTFKTIKKIIVYDYDTKAPISRAKIYVFSYPANKLVHQTQTNKKGEFILSLPPGSYYFSVKKDGYRPLEFIPLNLKNIFQKGRTDGYYEDLYYPEEIISIRETKSKQPFFCSIPLVYSQKSNARGVLRILKETLRIVSTPLFIIGTLVSIFVFVVNPQNLFNKIVLYYYMVLWVIYIYLFLFHKPGIPKVIDKKGNPIPLVLCRAFDLKGNIIETAVSNDEGKFIFTLSPGKYLLRFKKPGFRVKTKLINLKSLRQLSDLEIVLEEEKDK